MLNERINGQALSIKFLLLRLFLLCPMYMTVNSTAVIECVPCHRCFRRLKDEYDSVHTDHIVCYVNSRCCGCYCWAELLDSNITRMRHWRSALHVTDYIEIFWYLWVTRSYRHVYFSLASSRPISYMWD